MLQLMRQQRLVGEQKVITFGKSKTTGQCAHNKKYEK